MPETLSITVDFSKLPLAEIARARARTAAGSTARLSALAQLVLFGLAGFGLGTLAVIRFGPLDYDAAFFRALIPLAGLALGVLAARSRAQAKALTALAAAPCYATPRTLHFGPEGIGGLDARRIPWAWIDPIVAYEGGTALFYSPAHYVPVPDASLPEGMTRDALLSQIALWQQAALAPDA